MSDAPEPDQDRVTVRRGGLAFPWWTSVETVESIESGVTTFALEVAGAHAAAAGALREDDDVAVYVGDDLVVTGVIDEVSVSGDADGIGVRIAGRSSTRDVADCSAALGAKSGLTLLSLVRWLVADYRIEVVDEAGVGGKTIRSWRTEEGESIFDALDRLSRDHAFMVTDDAAGRLVLTRAGAGGDAGDKIVRGTDGFLEGAVTRSCAERYSHIVVRGQEMTDLDVDPDVQGGAEDTGIARFRQLIVRPERGMSVADAKARAAWEATTRAAKALTYTCTLRGWRKATGALWRKNETAEVLDGLCGVIGAELLVVEVTRSLTVDGGRTVAMRLAPPKAYTPQPAKVSFGAGYAYEEPDTTDPGAPDDLDFGDDG